MCRRDRGLPAALGQVGRGGPIRGLSPEALGSSFAPACTGTAFPFAGLGLKCVTAHGAEGVSACAVASPGDGEACVGMGHCC